MTTTTSSRIRHWVEPVSRWRSCFVATLFGLGVLSGAAIAQQPDAAHFAAPISGKKVVQYCVDLPVAHNDYRTFEIPSQCRELIELIESGDAYHANVVDRRMWIKVENDCRFFDFLTQHPRHGIRDFISGYDFRNARLDEMPIEDPCVFGSDADCAAPSGGPLRLLDRFPFDQLEGDAPGIWQAADCRLDNGVFFGRIRVENGKMRCETGARRGGIRLLTVDFADINGDGYLDAVLRLAPIGPGAIRTPLVLPLTRLSADGPLQVPGPGGTVPAAQ